MEKRIWIVFLLLIQIVVHGQSQEIAFEPPSSDFISLSLQTHEGKLRFGNQDEYFQKSDGTYISSRDDGYFEMDRRSSHNRASRHAFVELLKMRFKKEMFSAMDRNYFTEQKQNMYEEEMKSHTAQLHVLNLANALCNKTQSNRLFCNPKEEDCASIFPKDGYYNEPRNIKGWGGRGASEFQKLRAYTTFVEELFPSVEQWADTLYPDNTLEGYYVVKTQLGQYDFKAGGYWLHTHQFHNQGFLLSWHDLQPANSFERKLMHPNGSSLLLKMVPEKAEAFSEKNQQIFLTFKVSVSLNGLENYRADQLKTTFVLDSPIITIYSDDSLTRKVAEMDIGSVEIKTR
ncbi:hypothetical protein LDL77_16165 [Flagellimonas marinaquae]|uniref:hypothetical protein n=1 Tax=Flagellimonas aurea TaxID=2915619 RepID=UPI001CE1C7AF|nr:hypothetical protein LDL77_16165 [Allomuricauda aquimarina]